MLHRSKFLPLHIAVPGMQLAQRPDDSPASQSLLLRQDASIAAVPLGLHMSMLPCVSHALG